MYKYLFLLLFVFIFGCKDDQEQRILTENEKVDSLMDKLAFYDYEKENTESNNNDVYSNSTIFNDNIKDVENLTEELKKEHQQREEIKKKQEEEKAKIEEIKRLEEIRNSNSETVRPGTSNNSSSNYLNNNAIDFANESFWYARANSNLSKSPIIKNNAKKDKIKDTTKITELNGVVGYKSKKSYAELGVPEVPTSSEVDLTNLLIRPMPIIAILETAISSSRSGEFVAIVESDVFSVHSERILIPKYTRIMCGYDSNIAIGETTINATCDRAYLPNGKSFIFQGVVYDQMGRRGIRGEVDNRLWEKYGQTLLMTGIAGASSFINAKALIDADPDLGVFLSQTNKSINDLSIETLREYIKLKTIIRVASGTRVVIRTTEDINIESSYEKDLREKIINTSTKER